MCVADTKLLPAASYFILLVSRPFYVSQKDVVEQQERFHTLQQLAVFKAVQFRGKRHPFDQLKEFCISQGSAVTLLRRGGQMRLFLTELFK